MVYLKLKQQYKNIKPYMSSSVPEGNIAASAQLPLHDSAS